MEPPSTPRRPSSHSHEEPRTPTQPPTSARRRATRTSSGGSATPNLKLLSQSPQLRSRLAALSLSADALRSSPSSSSSSAFSGSNKAVTVDNIVVLEIGNRTVKAGFAGDASPRCTVPAELGWERVARTQTQYSASPEDRQHYHSLWTLRDLQEKPSSPDLSEPWYKQRPLKRFEAVLEVILAHIFNTELLVDPRQQRLALIENPLWPTPIRESIAKVCLKHLHAASIVFLESPVLDLIAAGLRSGIVVDVGWEETSVYPVYDLRVLLMNTKTSTRGSKLLHGNIEALLGELVDEGAQVPFGAVEAVVARALYTNGDRAGGGMRGPRLSMPMSVPVLPSSPSIGSSPGSDSSEISHQLDLSAWTPSGGLVEIPNHRLQSAVTRTFLHKHGDGGDDDDDDEQLDLATMISRVIFSLSMDVRGATQSTLIFVGAASRIPGLVSTVLQNARRLLRKRDIAAASSVMAAHSMGSWTGASLYMSSLAWYFAQDERIRLPGELSRDRYATVGYQKSTAPFGVIW